MEKRLKILLASIVAAAMVGFVWTEKKSFVKGTLGNLNVNISESRTLKNQISNSFGSSNTICIEGYNANLETQNQDTMIAVGIIKYSASNGNCSVHTPMNEIFKKGNLPFSVGGPGSIGKFGSLTIKINDKFYSTSLKVQPAGSSFNITAVTPFQTTNEDLLRSYKNFFRVDGVVTARMYNMMVAGDSVDVKGVLFSSVFAEHK